MPVAETFDPVEPRRWWGRHLQEVRWQAELARLMVDPVLAGRGVPCGNGGAVMLIPGFLAGDKAYRAVAEALA